jgi:hypothetical protein
VLWHRHLGHPVALAQGERGNEPVEVAIQGQLSRLAVSIGPPETACAANVAAKSTFASSNTSIAPASSVFVPRYLSTTSAPR